MQCALDTSIDRMRAETLDLLGFLNQPGGGEFDVITQLAVRQFGCKIALVSLIDSDRQHFLSAVGIDGAGIPRKNSFCAKAMDQDISLIIEDASVDPRFSANLYVVGAPHVRFYAGIPLRARVGQGEARRAVGTLCIIDDRPRQLDETSLGLLQDLARLAEALIEAWWAAKEVGRLMARSQAAIEELRREQRLFKQAERLAHLGSWRMPLAEKRLIWSDQVFVIHELETGEAPGLDAALDFYGPKDRLRIEATLARTLETGEPFDVESDILTAKGNRRRVRSVGELDYADGRPVALIGVFQDITHQHDLQETLRRHASTDELTRIANRAECNRVIDETMTRARDEGTSAALLLIDLDGFKAVNDRCGHLAGDDLLRRIGLRLRLPYLENAFVARLGGDEFVVLLSAPEDCARLDTIVDRLLSDLRETIPHPDGSLPVSGTIGISWLDEGVATRSDFLQQADIALYAAKKRQRGTAHVFNAPLERLPLAG